jgi:DNA-directed RNA polymerase subunit RPC12/RpoP
MKEYVFDEKRSVESMMNDGVVDTVNPTNTIRKLARYNFYVMQYGKTTNYNSIVEYMTANYNDFSEFAYQKDILGCIRDVEKTPWKDINKIDITKGEIDVIMSLDDIKKQKIAFVLLCTAKYRDAYNPNNCHKTDISVTDLYKMARVVLPQKERAIFLHFLVQDGLVEKHTFAGVKNKRLLFVSEDPTDEIVMSLCEIDFLELAYIYMDYISDHIGYARCERCGRMIKHSNTKPRKYCEECSQKVLTEQKRIWAEKNRKNLHSTK